MLFKYVVLFRFCFVLGFGFVCFSPIFRRLIVVQIVVVIVAAAVVAAVVVADAAITLLPNA